jgi:peptide deformylase
MADLLTLLPDNAPILHEPIAPFEVEHLSVEYAKELAERLHSTRRAYKAVGLAANQVGIKARIFVIGNVETELTCINPETILISETEVNNFEGCLSFPSLRLKVKRPATIKVRFLNENLEEKEMTLNGLLARCFQHELDHLNGIVFTEKVSKLVLAMAKKKAVKRFKKAK